MLSCNDFLDYNHWWLTTFILLLEFFICITWFSYIFTFKCLYLPVVYIAAEILLYHMVEPCFYIWMVVFVSMFILMLRFLYIHHIQGIKKLLSIDLFYNYSITHLNCLCFDSNLSKWFCCWIWYFEYLGSLIPVLFACLCVWLQVMLDCRIRNCSLKALLHLMYKAINLGTYYIRVIKCVWLAWCV